MSDASNGSELISEMPSKSGQVLETPILGILKRQGQPVEWRRLGRGSVPHHE